MLYIENSLKKIPRGAGSYRLFLGGNFFFLLWAYVLSDFGHGLILLYFWKGYFSWKIIICSRAVGGKIQSCPLGKWNKETWSGGSARDGGCVLLLVYCLRGPAERGRAWGGPGTGLSHPVLGGRAVNGSYPCLSLHLACILSPQFSFLDCMSPS